MFLALSCSGIVSTLLPLFSTHTRRVNSHVVSRHSLSSNACFVPVRLLFRMSDSSQSMLPFFVSFRQNGVGPNKTCADAILPKGHQLPRSLAFRKFIS